MSVNREIQIMIGALIASILIVAVPAKAEAPLQEVVTVVDINALAFDDPQAFALYELNKQELPIGEFVCLIKLWDKESHWNYKADNPNSSAYGIAQMLNEDSKHPAEQILNGLRYIEHRYDKPCNAWQFWLRKNWY